MSLHARLEKAVASFVNGLLLKLECAAIVHKLSELVGLAPAEVLKRRFNFLLFDVIVFFVFGATRQALPRQRTLQQVQ